MIPGYNSFLENKLLEGLVNESIIYFSPDLRKVIGAIAKSTRNDNDSIAVNLAGIEGVNVKPDITFLNIDADGYLSFITMRNAINLIKTQHPHIVNGDKDSIEISPNISLADAVWNRDISDPERSTDIYKKSRNQIKIGKLINKLFPGKYTDKDIEEFVNIFKSRIEKKGESFELVEGDDINYWYSSDNYKEMKGSLGNSCMRSVSDIFDLYVKNPEVCKLLILKEDDLLIGRAIVWKLSSFEITQGEKISDIESEVYFMDRQYTIRDSDEIKFKEYAIQKKWLYKTHNTHHNLNNVSYNNRDYRMDMLVKVKPYKGDEDYDYQRYPYLDTFKRYDPTIGHLHNDENEDYQECYILDDTSGSYRELNGVYSEWYDRTLDADEAVYSEPLSDYIIIDRAINVTRGTRRLQGWYPDSYDEIVYDEYLDEYIHMDNAVFSDVDQQHIFEDNAVSTVSRIEVNGTINHDECWVHEDNEDIVEIDKGSLWFEKLSNFDNAWNNHSYIMKELTVKDVAGDNIPKKFSVSIFKVESKSPPIEFLQIADAIALDYKIDNNIERIVDVFSYHKDISTRIESIKRGLQEKINSLHSKLKGDQLSIPIGDEESYNKAIENKLSILMKRSKDIKRIESFN